MPAIKTPQSLPTLPLATARRLLLGAQGLLDDPRRRVDAAGVGELIDRMGFVQLDSINFVERAHHLTLASRFDGYRPAHLTRLLEKERHLFEHWTHDASAIPVRWLPFWTHRFARHRTMIETSKWWWQRLGAEPEKMIGHVRERITREGPLLSRDFEGKGGSGSSSWWGWKPQKAVLDYLWHCGELAVLRRVNFHKVYDLTERVFPQLAELPQPSAEEHVDWACRTALERLGVGTASEIARFWQAVAIEEAADWCRRTAERGEIQPVEIDGSPSYAVLDWEERAARLPEAPARLRLLSPFDPVIRDRRRALRLFGFDFHFEAFVPEAKRVHGYYVLPILEGEQLVGRLDPKFERDRGTLVVRKVWWEPGIRAGRGRRAGLEAAVARLARTVGAEKFEL